MILPVTRVWKIFQLFTWPLHTKPGDAQPAKPNCVDNTSEYFYGIQSQDEITALKYSTWIIVTQIGGGGGLKDMDK